MQKPLATARMLLGGGVDVINIADGPRAVVRMSNFALGLKMMEQKTEVLLHVCCRDRNLIGLQMDLLGAHVMGYRNLVVITGDPPKLGDYPKATPVFDLDSIELLKLIDNLNRGHRPVRQGRRREDTVLPRVRRGAERDRLRSRDRAASRRRSRPAPR